MPSGTARIMDDLRDLRRLREECIDSSGSGDGIDIASFAQSEETELTTLRR